MKPGATTRPSALMRRVADSLNLPTPTIFPWCTATSAWNEGPPEPSTTRPFLISRSYVMCCPSSGCVAGPWPSVRWVLRGLSPRFDFRPHLRHRIQGRDECLHLILWVFHEEGLDGEQRDPEPCLTKWGLQARGRAVNQGQQHELRLLCIGQVQRPRNSRALL